MDTNIKTGFLAMAGAGVMAFAVGPAWAGDGTTVTSPESGSDTVVRTGDNGLFPMDYVVVRDSNNTVKFEDATVGLGEDGAIESDLFVIQVENAGDTVRVETKAGRDVSEWISGESDSDIDDNGFHCELVSIEGSTYTLRLTSTEAVDSALSHVTFEFFPGQQADASYD